MVQAGVVPSAAVQTSKNLDLLSIDQGVDDATVH
jgi:hypothetical protein